MRTSSAAASIEQQNAATSEITCNAISAARRARSVVAVLGQVTDAAVDTHATAETMPTASNSVDTSVDNLRAEVDRFLSKVAVRR